MWGMDNKVLDVQKVGLELSQARVQRDRIARKQLLLERRLEKVAQELRQARLRVQLLEELLPDSEG